MSHPVPTLNRNVKPPQPDSLSKPQAKQLVPSTEISTHAKAPPPSLFESDGWLEFNRIKWGVTPVRMRYKKEDAPEPSLEAVLYLNKQGKVFFPPRNPYALMRFRPTPTQSQASQQKQWLCVSQYAAEDFKARGLANQFVIPPGLTDIRSWQWSGYKIGVRYTHVLEFPFHPGQVEKDVRNKLKKAHAMGYRCDRSVNAKEILQCMRSTEIRQGFTHLLTESDLELLMSLLGEDRFRAYICYAPNGEPVSSDITLCGQDGMAYAWVGGTESEHLSAGVAQQIQEFALADLQQAGATGLDLVGANLPTVSASKMRWGGKLVPYYTIEPDGIGYETMKLTKTMLISFAGRLGISHRKE